MPLHPELSVETVDRLMDEVIGGVDLADDQLVDRTGAMATANTCYRSCAHTICFCIAC